MSEGDQEVTVRKIGTETGERKLLETVRHSGHKVMHSLEVSENSIAENSDYELQFGCGFTAMRLQNDFSIRIGLSYPQICHGDCWAVCDIIFMLLRSIYQSNLVIS